jgi:hypothetical protein
VIQGFWTKMEHVPAIALTAMCICFPGVNNAGLIFDQESFHVQEGWAALTAGVSTFSWV